MTSCNLPWKKIVFKEYEMCWSCLNLNVTFGGGLDRIYICSMFSSSQYLLKGVKLSCLPLMNINIMTLEKRKTFFWLNSSCCLKNKLVVYNAEDEECHRSGRKTHLYSESETAAGGNAICVVSIVFSFLWALNRHFPLNTSLMLGRCRR